MPRGTLVTTLYSAEIPWLGAFEHQLGDRSLLATLKGSLYPWLSDARTELSLLPTKRFVVIPSSEAMLVVTCASLTRRGWNRALRPGAAESPQHCTGGWGTAAGGLWAKLGLPSADSTVMHRPCPALRGFPCIAKTTAVLSATSQG